MGITTAPLIAAIAGTAASGVGMAESIGASCQASAGQQANIDIAQQELARKNQIFQQLQPFFSQYLQQGSPYLQNIQRAGAEQNAQQFGNAAGNLRQTMQTSGLGYGPSGTTAAAMGQLGQGAAQSSANSYLQNLLNNEQVKFQAAQGLGGLGNMYNGQNTVGQPPAPTANTIGSSVNAFGQSVNNLINQQNQGNNQGGNLPLTPPNPYITQPLNPLTGGTQGTQ